MSKYREEAIIMYATQFITLANSQNYANVSLIVDIAERMGVHAVWAGWYCPYVCTFV
jgi:biotin carboxylase